MLTQKEAALEVAIHKLKGDNPISSFIKVAWETEKPFSRARCGAMLAFLKGEGMFKYRAVRKALEECCGGDNTLGT